MQQTDTTDTLHRRRWPIVVALVMGILAGAGGLYALFTFVINRQQTVLPPELKSKVNFSVLAPPASKTTTFSNFQFDSSTGVLSFTLQTPDAQFMVTEQVTPDSFNDIPEYYDKLTQSLLEYKRFDTDIGQVSLTKPKEFNGQQAGVLNTKGTLMFARPDKDLSDESWRQFYNQLIVHK